MKRLDILVKIVLLIAIAVLLSLVVQTYAPPAASEALIYDTENCYVSCPNGRETSGNILIRRSLYTLSYNPARKMTDWVAYQVNPKNFKTDTTPSRSRNFRPDPLLPKRLALETADYTRAFRLLHMDRGHLVPLADVAGNEKWFTVNYLSNITPQSSNLNQGPWKRLEEDIRKYARKTTRLYTYVYAGTLFESNQRGLPRADESHVVPSGFWKIVISREVEMQTTVDAFIFSQQASRDTDYCRWNKSSVAQISKRTGLSFSIRARRGMMCR